MRLFEFDNDLLNTVMASATTWFTQASKVSKEKRYYYHSYIPAGYYEKAPTPDDFPGMTDELLQQVVKLRKGGKFPPQTGPKGLPLSKGLLLTTKPNKTVIIPLVRWNFNFNVSGDVEAMLQNPNLQTAVQVGEDCYYAGSFVAIDAEDKDEVDATLFPPLPEEPLLSTVMDAIKTNCGEFLSYIRAAGKHRPLYRGISGRNPTFMEVRGRQTRTPVTLSQQDHDMTNDFLARSGMTANRDNSSFATSNQFVAQAFGSIYLVFPKDGFAYTYFEDDDYIQSMRVFRNKMVQMREPLDGDDAKYRLWLSIANPHDDSLEDAINNGYEVMFTGDYYAVKKDFINSQYRQSSSPVMAFIADLLK